MTSQDGYLKAADEAAKTGKSGDSTKARLQFANIMFCRVVVTLCITCPHVMHTSSVGAFV